MQQSGWIEKSLELGALGGQHWFVPLFTVRQDPTITNYVDLRGEENRRKLAKMFLRPTNWRDYCTQVSNSTCRIPDKVAARAPIDDLESTSYFVKGLYTGYFRATEKNDCDRYPNNCTGHFADYPCGWSSFFRQQMHHLGIALESDGGEASGGYTYTQLTQIWAAANATKSNVMMLWWYPEQLYQSYLGTDAEFTPVVLPPSTQDCLDARVDPALRCEGNMKTQIGEKEALVTMPHSHYRR